MMHEDEGAIEKPTDWDDHAGWEEYYAATIDGMVRVTGAEPVGLSDGLRFAAFVLERETRKLWFPGCGLASCPRVYAALGLEVWASDVSSSAIQVQQRLADLPFEALEDRVGDALRRYVPDFSTARPGKLHALVHDFRHPFPEHDLDFILNLKAFQALPHPSMARAARVHFDALRPGGWAIFDTLNVQGERRTQIEDTLLQVGFTIPYSRSERWYRQALAETGIPHLFVLGQPFIARGDRRYKGRGGKRREEADQKCLGRFRAEYEERQRREQEEMEAVWRDSHTRIAVVVYNTG
jgi:SAM-dependent methyltransferase